MMRFIDEARGTVIESQPTSTFAEAGRHQLLREYRLAGVAHGGDARPNFVPVQAPQGILPLDRMQPLMGGEC